MPVFDEHGLIQGLSIHLDTAFNNCQDIWFSSSGKINGTAAKSWIMKNNIVDSDRIIITDNLLLGHLIKETINAQNNPKDKSKFLNIANFIIGFLIWISRTKNITIKIIPITMPTNTNG